MAHNVKRTIPKISRIETDPGNKRKNSNRRKVQNEASEQFRAQRREIVDQFKTNAEISFKSHAKAVFSNSLITSFPQIASYATWKRRLLKIVIFIICVFGFGYQTWDFLIIYNSYPTIMNVEFSTPYEIVQPAITVCNNNRRRRSFHCTQYYHHCETYSIEDLCEKYRRFCPLGRDNETLFPLVPTRSDEVRDLNFKEIPWDLTKEETHSEAIISECYKDLDGQRYVCSKPYLQIPLVIGFNSLPNYCYVIDSQTEQPNATETTYPKNLRFILSFELQPEEYLFYKDEVKILIDLHDRKMIVNPYSDGAHLKGGMRYRAFVSMVEDISLPHPYVTDCVDYLELWRNNNGTGPLNQQMCIEYCEMNDLLIAGKCKGDYIAYSHKEELCSNEDLQLYALNFEKPYEIVKSCREQCRVGCKDKRYVVEYKEEGRYERANYEDRDTEKCIEGDEHCKAKSIHLTIEFGKFRLTKRIQQPRYEAVELFSYIGGFMGLWLSISLVSLFDLVQTMFSLFLYPILRISRKNKVHVM